MSWWPNNIIRDWNLLVRNVFEFVIIVFFYFYIKSVTIRWRSSVIDIIFVLFCIIYCLLHVLWFLKFNNLYLLSAKLWHDFKNYFIYSLL